MPACSAAVACCRLLSLTQGLRFALWSSSYPPEVQAETTLINFMVTEDGLEDQLLALTVSKERPDLEEQKAEIIQSNNDNKIKMKELEDGILYQLANAEGDVTENSTRHSLEVPTCSLLLLPSLSCCQKCSCIWPLFAPSAVHVA